MFAGARHGILLTESKNRGHPQRRYWGMKYSMLMRRHFLVLAATTALAACATVPPPQLQSSQIQALKITTVEVQNVQGIRSWPKEHDAFIAKANLPAEVVNDIQTKSYDLHPPIFDHLRIVMQQEYANRLTNLLSGSRPVKAVVTVKQLHVPGLAARMLINNHAFFHADIGLVDLKTNAVLVTYQAPLKQKQMIGGVGAPIFDAITQGSVDYGRLLIAESVSDFGEWLRQAP